MKSNFLIIFCFMNVLLCSTEQNRVLEFVTPDYFIKHIVASEDKEDFKVFYKDFAKNLKSCSDEKKATTMQKIRADACNNLAIKHPQWAQALEPYNYFERSEKKMLESSQRKQVLSFLTRYGIYELYLAQKAQKKSSFWCKIKAYTKDVGQQIAQLTGSLKRTFGA